MNPKHGESVRDPDTGELLVWRTLPAGSRRARSNITIVRGVHSGELRMLCTLLRDNRPLAPEVREAVAAMLEKLFWNEPSGASEYTEKTRTLRAWLMRAYIEARVAEMKQAGERPRGGRRAAALAEVGKLAGMESESVRRQLARKNRDKL